MKKLTALFLCFFVVPHFVSSEEPFDMLKIKFENTIDDKLDMGRLASRLKTCPHLKLLSSRANEPGYSYIITIGSSEQIDKLREIDNQNWLPVGVDLGLPPVRAKTKYGAMSRVLTGKNVSENNSVYVNSKNDLLESIFNLICRVPLGVKNEIFLPLPVAVRFKNEVAKDVDCDGDGLDSEDKLSCFQAMVRLKNDIANQASGYKNCIDLNEGKHRMPFELQVSLPTKAGMEYLFELDLKSIKEKKIIATLPLSISRDQFFSKKKFDLSEEARMTLFNWLNGMFPVED